MHMEPAGGRFHSSWAFTRDLYEKIGGYAEYTGLDFDQRIGFKLAEADPRPPIDETYCPAYVYRWGNTTYHGSAQGMEGYATLWDALGKQPAPFMGKVVPAFDEETKLLSRIGATVFAQFLMSK
jgi:hypothetical protein